MSVRVSTGSWYWTRHNCWLMRVALKRNGAIPRFPTYDICIVITWWHHQVENLPCYWPFVREIHQLSINSPHKGQWHGALMFSLICAWINGWVNNGEAGDLRRHWAHYDVTVMYPISSLVLSHRRFSLSETIKSKRTGVLDETKIILRSEIRHMRYKREIRFQQALRLGRGQAIKST